MYETLKIERHGPVGWLINNRPERLNAMNNAMRDEFAEAWKELDADPAVRVIVHTGEGKAFQTGVDVIEIASDGIGFERYRESSEKFDFHFTSWHNDVWKPVITAVNGICAGGGFHWIADADIVIAASDATFLDPHVSVGQVAAYELIGLARRMPFEAVLRMALVGRHERMSAERALALGMISQVVDPPERLREEAQALAEKIARNSPAAMAATKRALWGALEQGLTDACKAGATELVSMWGHPDQVEGPAGLRREAGAAVGHHRGVRGELTRGSAAVELHRVSDRPGGRAVATGGPVSGIDATYGAPFGALEVVPVAGAVAPLFAAAHQRVHGARAAAHRGDGIFWLPGLDHEPASTIEVGLGRGVGGGCSRTCRPRGSRASPHPGPGSAGRGLGPAAPCTRRQLVGACRRNGPGDGRRLASLVLLAGPGVIRDGAVPGLHDLAVSAGVGVLNTWGAKGVFDWRSRHHLATMGLQADDFVLSGLDRADLIIATGLDPAESPDERWRLAPALTVPPAGLAPLAERCGPSRRPPLAMPPLRARLAEVTQRGWRVEAQSAATQPGDHALRGMCRRRCAGCGRRRRRRLLGGAHARHDPARGGDRAVHAFPGVCRGLCRGLAAPPPWPSGLGRDRSRRSRGNRGDRGRGGSARGRASRSRRGIPTAIASTPMPTGSGCVGWSSAGSRQGDRLCTLATDPRQLSEMIEAAGPIVAWT